MRQHQPPSPSAPALLLCSGPHTAACLWPGNPELSWAAPLASVRAIPSARTGQAFKTKHTPPQEALPAPQLQGLHLQDCAPPLPPLGRPLLWAPGSPPLRVRAT